MKGFYETGDSAPARGFDAGPTPERPVCIEVSTLLVLNPNASDSDAYAHPSAYWSPANASRDAVADSNFGTDYARRGVYRDWGGSARNPCLGRQWALDLGGYRQTRRGPHQFSWPIVPTFVRQEV